MKILKVTTNNIVQLYKGIISNLATIGVISQFIPDRQQEKIERESQALLEYAQRKQQENNRRNSRKLN